MTYPASLMTQCFKQINNKNEIINDLQPKYEIFKKHCDISVIVLYCHCVACIKKNYTICPNCEYVGNLVYMCEKCVDKNKIKLNKIEIQENNYMWIFKIGKFEHDQSCPLNKQTVSIIIMSSNQQNQFT